MPSIPKEIFRNYVKPVLKYGTDAIKNGISENDAKFILGSSILMDTSQNVYDYVEIGKNDKLSDDHKKYLQAYKLTNAGVEATIQLAAGSIILNKKVQEHLRESYEKLTGHIPEMCINKNFRVLTILVGCVVLAKRIIAPLIVTPLTTYIRKKLEDKKA